MILVDSSVWIDFFRGVETPECDELDRLLGYTPVATGDIILVEVLQGFVSDRDFARALHVLNPLTRLQIADPGLAIQAAQNYRMLRTRGITVRKTVDTLIATRCIEDHLPLLYSDRDFDPFVHHLGLVSALRVT